MSQLADQINNKIEEVFSQAVYDRRYLHQHPELSFNEFETSAYIRGRLDAMNIPFRIVAKTGVVAVLEGELEDSDDVVVIRADIDALPIEEKNAVDYRSEHNGVMHACGHDFHTANLLGVASIINGLRSYYSGKILLLFQPAEEKIPGGAIQVLESGILESFGGRIKAVLGLHVSPRLSLGKIGICAGRFMASSDEFYLTIKGRGGHAAEPHRAVDPIMIAVQLLSALQQIVSRKSDPNTPSVLTFGRFEGKGAANVIPEEVILEGTFRTVDEKWRAEALQQIEGLINTLPNSLGASVQLEIRRGYPTLYNDPELAARSKELWTKLLGQDRITDVGIWMAAEDFAYYSHKYPSLFVLVGTDNGRLETQYGLHNAQFNLDEEALRTSIPALVHLVFDLLKG
ncbi:M20 metallopeptidase family protein [Sphingobacterium yanglingense]|uniref:Amidohydrolase n=1 Tax=Sphingobacterium yanglingense TaxID=1437280 RepID=A0A4R6W4V4_9SPHI|nr:M20 family metallopeptidase [Sphingobacterium yanglingense]TDQ73737.1 amidohydrolase [Sphingobacterium yanglingense]